MHNAYIQQYLAPISSPGDHMSILKPACNLNIIITCLSLLLYQASQNLLFISLSVQLYIPGQHYSLIDLSYNIGAIENRLFNIDISLQLNQTTQQDQTNTIFDFLSVEGPYSSQFVSCYQQNFNYLNSRYEKYQPCHESCALTSLPTSQSQYMQIDYFVPITGKSPSGNNVYIIDNTFYPCKGGAYQPELYLQQFINITIQENERYGLLIKLVFVLLLQLMIVIIAYLVIMFRKYRKLRKRLEYLKGQLEAQDLLNSFMSNNTNTLIPAPSASAGNVNK